jgi:hypothetical protein
LIGADDELSGDDELAGELAAMLGGDDELAGELSDVLHLSGDEIAELVELGFSFKKLIRGVGKIAKKALPIVKAIGVVTAFVIPPAGVAITAAAAGADKLISAAEKGGKAASTAKKAFKATNLLASKGDKSAIAGLGVLARVQAERKKAGVPKGASHPKLKNVAIPRATLTKTVRVAPAANGKPVQITPVTKAAANPAAVGERGFFVSLDGRIQRRGV